MRVLLIDGLNLIRRVYAGVPPEEDQFAHRTSVANAVTASVARALRKLEPTHAIAVMDSQGPSWRHTEFPEYKANRKPMPEALAQQLPELEAAVRELGVHAARVDGFEADDVIATIATRLATREVAVVVLSTDKSMLTLLPAGVRIYHHFEGKDLDEAYVRNRFGIPSAWLPAFLALAGDNTQNVPGVRGVGPKTAVALLTDADGSVETVIHNAAKQTNRHARAVLEQADEVRRFETISRLRTGIDVGMNLSDFRLR